MVHLCSCMLFILFHINLWSLIYTLKSLTVHCFCRIGIWCILLKCPELLLHVLMDMHEGWYCRINMFHQVPWCVRSLNLVCDFNILDVMLLTSIYQEKSIWPSCQLHKPTLPFHKVSVMQLVDSSWYINSDTTYFTSAGQSWCKHWSSSKISMICMYTSSFSPYKPEKMVWECLLHYSNISISNCLIQIHVTQCIMVTQHRLLKDVVTLIFRL